MLKTCISVESCLERFAGSRDAVANQQMYFFFNFFKNDKNDKSCPRINWVCIYGGPFGTVMTNRGTPIPYRT